MDTIPYYLYADALATIESLKHELEMQNTFALIAFLLFIFAIIALICYTKVKKTQVKYFGSSEEYEMFMAWKKKQAEKKKLPKDTND